MNAFTSSVDWAPCGSSGDPRQLQYVHAFAQPNPLSFQLTMIVKLIQLDRSLISLPFNKKESPLMESPMGWD
jgi:hypothetical protein